MGCLPQLASAAPADGTVMHFVFMLGQYVVEVLAHQGALIIFSLYSEIYNVVSAIDISVQRNRAVGGALIDNRRMRRRCLSD